MLMKRIILAILIITIVCMVEGLVYAGPSAESGGPALGKWEFTGKDDLGASWTGMLAVQKLDTNSFDANRFHSMFTLEATSGDSSYGVEAPCRWEPSTREVSFSTGSSAYTAILSPDGKSLIQGKWTNSERDYRTRKATVIRTGVWSGKFVAP
jgi:hypothetical protein